MNILNMNAYTENHILRYIADDWYMSAREECREYIGDQKKKEEREATEQSNNHEKQEPAKPLTINRDNTQPFYR